MPERGRRTLYFCEDEKRPKLSAWRLVVPSVFFAHTCEEEARDDKPAVRVGHDDEPLSRLGVHFEHRLETLIRAVMPELAGIPFLKEETQSSVVHHRSQHLLGHFFREYVVRLALLCEGYLDGEHCKIGRRGPQSRGSHFRVNVPAAVYRIAVIG